MIGLHVHMGPIKSSENMSVIKQRLAGSAIIEALFTGLPQAACDLLKSTQAKDSTKWQVGRLGNSTSSPKPRHIMRNEYKLCHWFLKVPVFIQLQCKSCGLVKISFPDLTNIH